MDMSEEDRGLVICWKLLFFLQELHLLNGWKYCFYYVDARSSDMLLHSNQSEMSARKKTAARIQSSWNSFSWNSLVPGHAIPVSITKSINLAKFCIYNTLWSFFTKTDPQGSIRLFAFLFVYLFDCIRFVLLLSCRCFRPKIGKKGLCIFSLFGIPVVDTALFNTTAPGFPVIWY